MHWLETWRALSARIAGLIDAANFLASALRAAGNQDHFGVVGGSFLPELRELNSELQRFNEAHGDEMPRDARRVLTAYVHRAWNGHGGLGPVDVQAIAPIALFRSQFEFFIRDSEAISRTLVELAFEHLRRSIMVDARCRSQWQEAFDSHETKCEQLGAVHLLSHGVWGFKVAGGGAATDLVLDEPIRDELGLVQRTARTLVLTEWKRVSNAGELAAKAQEARTQAEMYASGILSSLELRRTRYVVLVGKDDVVAPDDVLVGAVTYRHIVVPTDPKSPSQSARTVRRPAG